ncbi:MAG: o-succinylbenzoate synthase [Bacteroidota bacterium]
MKASYQSYELKFIKPARTSRGEMKSHTAYIIQLQQGNFTAFGEASPIPGLSRDTLSEMEQKLSELCEVLSTNQTLSTIDLTNFPSIQFACEVLQLNMKQRVPFKVFDCSFYNGHPIKINGLVWMNSIDEMIAEAKQKIAAGFSSIKFKVGAHDFDAECRMLEHIRKLQHPFQLDIRLDANGAFTTGDAIEKLRELSRFAIHSIEQPVKPNQHEFMHELCVKSKIPIALDEELIGHFSDTNKEKLLTTIRPHYIILKPTLLGGFAESDAWIKLAQENEIGWWATSSLESNIALNALAQWCSTHPLQWPQGLGTGSLYANNIPSPLRTDGEYLISDYKNAEWDVTMFDPN